MSSFNFIEMNLLSTYPYDFSIGTRHLGQRRCIFIKALDNLASRFRCILALAVAAFASAASSLLSLSTTESSHDEQNEPFFESLFQLYRSTTITEMLVQDKIGPCYKNMKSIGACIRL